MSLAVVTGADRGIGAALCEALAARGSPVLAACLGDGAALAAVADVELAHDIDVTSAAGVARLVAQLGGRDVTHLIHCAGVVHEQGFGAFDYALLMSEYAVNALGPLRVTEALLERLGAGAKVALITSRVGSLAENGTGGLYGYRMSKAAANMAGINLAHELRARGVAVACLHPGSVRTAMTAGLADQTTVGGLIEPAEAARGLLARLDELTLATSGGFRHANGQTLPW